MSTLRITADDRDAAGKIKMGEPRSLEDLLPRPEAIRASAARPQKLSRNETIALVVVGALALFLFVHTAITPGASIPESVVQPTAITQIQAAQPPAAPTALPVRLLAAFDQPAGRVLGTIEITRTIVPVAHYDAEWIQADVSGSGRVWLRTIDLPEAALTGPNLAPKAAPAVVVPAWSAPAAPIVEAAPTVPPTVLAVLAHESNGQKVVNGGWCSGSHLDNPECQGAHDVDHGVKATRP